MATAAAVSAAAIVEFTQNSFSAKFAVCCQHVEPNAKSNEIIFSQFCATIVFLVLKFDSTLFCLAQISSVIQSFCDSLINLFSGI